MEETTAEVEKLAEEIRLTTGETPIVVGMSKWSIASALAFYDQNNSLLDIRSRNMFGEPAAMYSFWYPSEPPTTRPILLVGMKQQALEPDSAEGNIEEMLIELKDTNFRPVYRQDGVLLRTLYYRIAEGYRGNSLSHYISNATK